MKAAIRQTKIPTMDHPTERTPLLSDEAMIELARLTEYPSKSAENVRDFYEALIISGDMRVVKIARVVHAPAFGGMDGPGMACGVCGTEVRCGMNKAKWCLECGSKLADHDVFAPDGWPK